MAIGFAQWETTLGRLIPPHALSRVTSLDWFTTVGLMPLGYAVAGPLADAVRPARDDGRRRRAITVALFVRRRSPSRDVRAACRQESIAS